MKKNSVKFLTRGIQEDTLILTFVGNLIVLPFHPNEGSGSGYTMLYALAFPLTNSEGNAAWPESEL